jgi:hypothetical protein
VNPLESGAIKCDSHVTKSTMARRRTRSRNNNSNGGMSIIPLESVQIGTTATFLPAGSVLHHIRGWNAEGPDYMVHIQQGSFGASLQTNDTYLIAKNGTNVNIPQLRSFMTNISSVATAAGEQSLALTLNSSTSSTPLAWAFYSS